MRILFLDDSDSRWHSFQSRVPAAWRAITAADCIAKIKGHPELRWLFLDHDLGGETWVDSSREDCGMEVVRFLCKHADKYASKLEQVVVHSHNVVAAKEMFQKLKDAGYNTVLCPFYSLISATSFNFKQDDED